MTVSGTNFHRLGLQKLGVYNRRSATWSRVGGGRFMGYIGGSRVQVTNNYWNGCTPMPPMYAPPVYNGGIWNSICNMGNSFMNGLMTMLGLANMFKKPAAKPEKSVSTPPQQTVLPTEVATEPVVVRQPSAVINAETTNTETVTFAITRNPNNRNETTGWDRILGSFTCNDQALSATQRNALKAKLRETYLKDPTGKTFFTGAVVLPKEITVGSETFVADEDRYNDTEGQYWAWTQFSNSDIKSKEYTYSAKEQTTYIATITKPGDDGTETTEDIRIEGATNMNDAKSKLANGGYGVTEENIIEGTT